MPELPRVTAREAIRAFGKAGFEHVRTSGSHAILKKEGHPYILSIPTHGTRTLGLGLLKKLIDAAGLTVEEFIALHES